MTVNHYDTSTSRLFRNEQNTGTPQASRRLLVLTLAKQRVWGTGFPDRNYRSDIRTAYGLPLWINTEPPRELCRPMLALETDFLRDSDEDETRAGETVARRTGSARAKCTTRGLVCGTGSH
ncbi:hypothetical protein BaRGS_00009182 [Batillaria attramentaria]|uniref:Uncharacterized protein n=1 Tax=Batillaria attramentaria TaxID=370345 RepID=A0ABD0LJF8_9CAEN